MNTNTSHASLDRHARTVLPGLVHDRLRHLALDLDVSLADLLVEGAILVLRFHGRGEGLPEPTSPATSTEPRTTAATTTNSKPTI